MIKSKYLETFKKFESKGALYGNRMLLEIVDQEDLYTSKGGILLATSSNQKSTFDMLQSTIGIVLEVGQGYYDPTTKEDVPLDLEVGNVVAVPAMGLSYVTTLPEISYGLPEKVFAYGSEGEIIKRWKTLEEFNESRAQLTELMG